MISSFGISEIKKEALLYLEKQPPLESIGGCQNLVFKLPSRDKFAYFKIEREQDNNSPIMEKIVWNAAKRLGFEEFFTETTTLTIRESSTIKMLKVYDRDNENTLNLFPPIKGSIQPEQEGWLLGKYRAREISKTVPLSRLKIAQALIVAALFGFSDAHDANIIITEKGEIKFFDNTRSFPHSNAYLVAGGAKKNSEVWHAFRCAFLDEPQSAENLDENELETLGEMLKICEENLWKVEEYFNSEKLKKKISTLAWGWLNSELAMKAFKQRLFLLKNAIHEKKLKKLEDLPCLLNPEYKMWFGLDCFNGFYKRRYQTSEYSELKKQEIHDNVSYRRIYNGKTSIIHNALSNDLELAEIKKFSQISTYEELTKNVFLLYLKTIQKPLSKEQKKLNKIETNKFILSIQDLHEIDNKSIPRELCNELHLEWILEKIRSWINLHKDRFFEAPIKDLLLKSESCSPKELFPEILKNYQEKAVLLKEFEQEICASILENNKSEEFMELRINKVQNKTFSLKANGFWEEFLQISFNNEKKKEKTRKKLNRTTWKIFANSNIEFYSEDKIKNLLYFLK